MKINYKIENKNYSIAFCRDGEGTKIKKKSKPYTHIGKDLNKLHKNQNVLIIIDKKIDKKIISYLIHDLKLTSTKFYIYYLNGEKKNKNQKNLFKIINFLFDKKFIKKSVLISFGGGVIGDICGLASSLYLRGLIHLSIPSTMTAIIDSCVGGKTGINYRGAINSIGNYYHPKKIYISKNIISMLPQREFLSGVPEILKCGLIDNNSTIKLLQNKKKFLSRNFSYISKIINLTLKTKIKLVSNDVYEENNRLKLNFGHTFAHAIEMALAKINKNKKEIRHGEAVGIGILCEIYYAKKKNKDFNLIKNILQNYNLPINLRHLIKDKISIKNLKKNIFKNIYLDKKRVNKFPRYIKLLSKGESKISELKSKNRIKETINKIIF